MRTHYTAYVDTHKYTTKYIKLTKKTKYIKDTETNEFIAIGLAFMS